MRSGQLLNCSMRTHCLQYASSQEQAGMSTQSRCHSAPPLGPGSRNSRLLNAEAVPLGLTGLEWDAGFEVSHGLTCRICGACASCR